MKTYKRLGLRMIRGNSGTWDITGNKCRYSDTGNKGIVMFKALQQWQNDGIVVMKNGRWQYADSNDS